VTVVGQNDNGIITPWKGPAGWLCKGSPVIGLKPGVNQMDDMFGSMQSEVDSLKWILRLVGFLVLWFAFSLCLAPLEVMADCIPCIGPFLGDAVAAISCCISCLPATGCFLIVAGLVWCAMRPLIAIPVLLVSIAVMLVTGYYSYNYSKRLGKDGAPLTQGAAQATYSQFPQGATIPVQAQPQPIQPVQAQPQPLVQQMPVAQPVSAVRQMQVTVPENVNAGDLIQIQTPEGVMMQVNVPAGLVAGNVFLVSY